MDAALLRIAEQAVGHWPLPPVLRIEPVKLRENAVFAVHCADGSRWALRVHRPGYHDDAALHSERLWMEALDAHGVEVPRLLLSRAGRGFEQVASRRVDLLEWITGCQLGELVGQDADLPAMYRTLGELAARMHLQAAGWTRPDGFHRHAWDREALVGERPLWGRFWDLQALTPSQRDLLLTLRERAAVELARFGQADDRYGLIHADLVPENVLVDGPRLRIIDFDDAGFGWQMFELATTLYFIRRQPCYAAARDAWIDGYRRHRPLSDEQLRLLPLFLAVRGSTYLGWVHTRAGEPTSQELTPMLIELACAAARDYLESAHE